MSDQAEPWAADWATVSREQHRAWARLSPDERLRWLEDALRFADAAGVLAADRRRRAQRTHPARPAGLSRDPAAPRG